MFSPAAGANTAVPAEKFIKVALIGKAKLSRYFVNALIAEFQAGLNKLQAVVVNIFLQGIARVLLKVTAQVAFAYTKVAAHHIGTQQLGAVNVFLYVI